MVNQGDIIKLNFDPQSGHEQKGRGQALVISNSNYTKVTGNLAMVCPVTRTDKNLPFHVKLDDRTKTTGVVLCDQAKMVDIRARSFEFTEKAPKDIVFEVIDIVTGFIDPED